jgi:AcrR family transcriptional regulator
MTEIDNKERILAKSSELFMQYGIRSVSMDDIAGALGMSKKTIYQYFADKDELVNEVIRVILEDNEQNCSRDCIVAENAVDEMMKAIEMMEEMFRTMNPSVLFDLKKYHPKAYSIFEKHKSEYLYTVIRDNLVRGIREELYRPDLNIDIIAHLRIDSMMLPFDPTLFNKQGNSLVTVSRQILEHYLFGIVSLKGYNLVLQYQNTVKL